MRTIAIGLWLVACAACRTDRVEEPRGLSMHRVETLTPSKAWRVVDGERVLGAVVLYTDPSAPNDPSKQYFSVRNEFQQELGTLDGLGRAWRFVPHRREAELVGAGTVLDGARRILAAGPGAELRDVALDELARRDER